MTAQKRSTLLNSRENCITGYYFLTLAKLFGLLNVGRDFNVTGDSNFNSGGSLAEAAKEAAKELEQLLDTIISRDSVAAQESAKQSAKEAVKRLPALTDPQVLELTDRNYPTLRKRFQSAITAMGIETVKLIFAPAGIPIEGVKAWINPGQ